MKKAYDSFGGLQAVTDHPVMWIGLGLLKEKEACRPTATAAKRRKLLSQVKCCENSQFILCGNGETFKPRVLPARDPGHSSCLIMV